MANEKFKKYSNGFTLIELIVSIGILAVIFAISSIVLSTIIPSTSQTTSSDVLISDLKAQQALAMSTDAYYGVHFEATSYTLFTGSTYSPTGSSNFIVNLDPTLSFSEVDFSGSQIVFSPGTGDIAGYIQGNDEVTLANSQTNKITKIKINQYGATY